MVPEVSGGGRALILGSTTSSQPTLSGESLEQYAAQAAGFSVTVASDSTWEAMTTADFEQYQLLIIGDPDCGDSVGTGTVAYQTAAEWEPAVMSTGGNKLLLGANPAATYYTGNGYGTGSGPGGDYLPNAVGAKSLVQAGVSWAGSVGGATGLYMDLSCTYTTSGNHTTVPILNGLSSFGSGQFTVTTHDAYGQPNIVNLVAYSQAMGSLNDNALDWYEPSGQLMFNTFPADYTMFALAPSDSEGDTVPAGYCATDVTTGSPVCGLPYILASGQGLFRQGRR